MLIFSSVLQQVQSLTDQQVLLTNLSSEFSVHVHSLEIASLIHFVRIFRLLARPESARCHCEDVAKFLLCTLSPGLMTI